jgi:hypothetical protein
MRIRNDVEPPVVVDGPRGSDMIGRLGVGECLERDASEVGPRWGYDLAANSRRSWRGERGFAARLVDDVWRVWRTR